jgi:TrpR-related protein YerC/YecD
MKPWKTPKLKKLAQALQSLKSEPDLLNFLRDLCTLEELAVLSARFEAVRLLEKGLPYRDIAKKTGLSTTTVTRISHWLHHGEGGYRAALRQTKK